MGHGDELAFSDQLFRVSCDLNVEEESMREDFLES